MNDSDVRSKLRAFITRDLIRDAAYPLTDGEGIVSNGLMDSFALAELGVFVEKDVYKRQDTTSPDRWRTWPVNPSSA